MSTAPILNDQTHPNWEGQFPEILDRYRNFSTRAEAYDDLVRMAGLAQADAVNYPATDGFHTNIIELMRTTLQAYLAGDHLKFGTVLHIAKLADRYEAESARH